MTLNLLVGSLALVSYICGAILLAKQIVRRHTQYHHPVKFGWLGLLMHATYMGLNIVNHQNFDFSFFNAGALVGLCIVALLLIASIDKPVEKLGIAVYPLAALLLGLDLIFPEQTRLLSNERSRFKLNYRLQPAQHRRITSHIARHTGPAIA
jgi:ABC-type uncharacterized transport system permease subunit